MSIEAMKQALEALETCGEDEVGQGFNETEVKQAITSLRQAIEQAEKNQFNPDWDAMAVMVDEQQRMAKRIEELEQAEKQEPVKMVAYNCLCGRIMKFESVNGIVAPQREWVGLTDEEIDGLVANTRWHELIKATEAKLKEKNT